jgi:uncharacterized damage-inducible protein DinB
MMNIIMSTQKHNSFSILNTLHLWLGIPQFNLVHVYTCIHLFTDHIDAERREQEDFDSLGDMDFLELTASQEHLLMESISAVTWLSSDQISAARKNVATHHEVTSRVLTEKNSQNSK